MMLFFSALIAANSLIVPTLAANSWIVPGAVWKTNSGATIDAHGGMVWQQGDTFYWIGQAVSDAVTPYIYTSKNLRDWDLTKPDHAVSYMWRPKFAKPNNQFWIYGQTNREVQALKSSSINSGYKLSGKSVRLPPNSYSYSDTGMFNEPGTNKWYLLTSADHNTVQINQINADGTVGTQVNRLAKGAYEAPGLVKAGGIYYLIVSGKTGYRNNPNKVFWTDKLEGGSWNGPTDIAPQNTNTYNSQNTHELVVQGSKKTTYVYMGDSWVKGGGAGSTYIWLPIQVDSNGKKLTLEYHAQWKIDTVTGEVSYPKKKKRYEAEDAAIEGEVEVAECGHCISKRGVRDFSNDSAVTFGNVVGRGGPQWVQLHYRAADVAAAEAFVSVNDGPVHKISSLNSRAGYHDVVPVELDLDAGANNITFSVTKRDAKADAGIMLDAIEVVEN